MRELNNLLGKRFGRLTVIKREQSRTSPNGTPKTMWLCQCDCGNKRIVGACNLARKDRANTSSCGCMRLDVISSKQWLKVEYFRYIKSNRRKRIHLIFQLSEHKFGELILGNCSYCGAKPAIRMHVGGRLRNGIDRINNSVGYVDSNCVTCCPTCNKMKGTLAKDEFLIHTKKIAAALDVKK